MAIQPGESIGPYVVEGFLGQGGMGEVYRAYDPRLERAVAIKVLPEDFASDFERLRRFDQEAKSLAQISHPHVVQIYDTGLQGDVSYLVMELLDGQSLRASMAQGPIPMRQTVQIVAQIAEALDAVHAKGILHRDLKPENVFVTREGRVKVLDFGLAKKRPILSFGSGDSAAWDAAQSATGEFALLGTAGYMAPEQLLGKAVDQRADLFALGTILWEMLTGRQPFLREHPWKTVHAIMEEELPALSADLGVSPYLESILRRCLEKDPASRFQSAKDLLFVLKNLDILAVQRSSTFLLLGRFKAYKTAMKIGFIAACLAGGGAWWFRWMSLRQKTLPIPRVKCVPLSLEGVYVASARFNPDGDGFAFSSGLSAEDPRPRIYTYRQGDAFSKPTGQFGKLLALDDRGEVFFTDLQYSSSTWEGNNATLFRWRGSGSSPKEWLPFVQDMDVTRDGQRSVVLRYHEGVMSSGCNLECPAGNVIAASKTWMSCPRFSPDGTSIAYIERGVTDGLAGRIKVISLEGKAIAQSIPMEAIASLAWSPSGKEVVFTSVTGSNPILVGWDLKGTFRTVLEPCGPFVLLDISSKGRLLLAGIEIRAQPAVESAGTWSTLPWRGLPSALSPDGSLLGLFLWEATRDGSAYVYDMKAKRVTRLDSGTPIGFSEDNREVLIRKPANYGQVLSADLNPADVELVSVPIGTGTPTRYPSEGIKDTFRAFYIPGSKRICVLGWGGQSLKAWVLDPASPPKPIEEPNSTFRYQLIVPLGCGYLFRNKDTWYLRSWSGGEARKIAGLTPLDWPIAWDPKQREIIVRKYPFDPNLDASKNASITSFRIERCQLDTGRRWLDRMQTIYPREQLTLIDPPLAGAPTVVQRDLSRESLYLVDGALNP